MEEEEDEEREGLGMATLRLHTAQQASVKKFKQAKVLTHHAYAIMWSRGCTYVIPRKRVVCNLDASGGLWKPPVLQLGGMHCF